MWNNMMRSKVKANKSMEHEEQGRETEPTNPKLEAKGEAEPVAGKVQEKTGEARRKTGNDGKKGQARRLPANSNIPDFVRRLLPGLSGEEKSISGRLSPPDGDLCYSYFRLSHRRQGCEKCEF